MRRRSLALVPHDVYRIFDDAGRLLYVGCSVNAFSRVPQHKHERQPWWRYARTVNIERYGSKRTARWIEASAINTEAPIWNKAKELTALAKFCDYPEILESIKNVDIEHFWASAAGGIK